MNKGAMCASVLAFLLLLTLVPFSGQAAGNQDAYFVKESFADQAVKGEESASFDYLEVRVVFYVNVSGPGQYNLTAGLEAGGGEMATCSTAGLYSQGQHSVTLRFRNRDVYNGRAIGRYSVHLTLKTPNFPLAPVEDYYTTSQSYHYSDFNPDFFAPYPPGSEFLYTDGQDTTTIRNNYMTFIFEKGTASMRYYFTQDQGAGKNGRFSVTFVRVLGYQDRGFGFNRSLAAHEASLAGGFWKIGALENGTHRAFGPYMRFNIIYSLTMRDQFGSTAATVNVTLSFYFSGNPRTSSDRLFTIAGSTQAELMIDLELSNTIGDTGLALETILTDSSRNHDFLLRDAIGDFKYNETNPKTKEYKLSPRLPDTIPKITFMNKWDAITYGVFSWPTPARSVFSGSEGNLNTDVTYVPEGRNMRLYLAYPARGNFIGVHHDIYFGLEGTQPPPTKPLPGAGERHDPLLYLLGSFLALAIIYLTMRLRSRSYVEEDEQLERIEELELSEDEPAPVSIQENVEGEEEEWRRKFEQQKESEDAPGKHGEPPEAESRPSEPPHTEKKPSEHPEKEGTRTPEKRPEGPPMKKGRKKGRKPTGGD